MAPVICNRSRFRTGIPSFPIVILLVLATSLAANAQSYPGLPRVDRSLAPTVEPSITVDAAPNSFTPLPKLSTQQDTAPRTDLNNVGPKFELSPTPIKPTPIKPITINPVPIDPAPLQTPSVMEMEPVAQVPNTFIKNLPPRTLFNWGYGGEDQDSSDELGPIVTDRPDFTEASSTVGLGVAQLEFGYTYTFDNDGTTQTKENSFGEPLLRYGVFADWLELRLAYNYLSEEINGARNSGGDDLYLGFKLGITPQQGILPEMALIPQMTVPTGDGPSTSNQVLPGLNWIYGWEINDRWSTAGSTQFNISEDDNRNRYTEWAQSWTLAYSWTEKLGSYAETFGLMPNGAIDVKPEYYFNGGFTYLLSDNIQWDIRGGLGLNDAASDYFLGSGFSVRYAGGCSSRENIWTR